MRNGNQFVRHGFTVVLVVAGLCVMPPRAAAVDFYTNSADFNTAITAAGMEHAGNESFEGGNENQSTCDPLDAGCPGTGDLG